MNKKVINGLILFVIGAALTAAGVWYTVQYFGTGLLYFNSIFGKWYFVAPVIAVVGFIIFIIGYCKAVNNFEKKEKKPKEKKEKKAAPAAPVAVPAKPAGQPADMKKVGFVFCADCGTKNKSESKFCASCGKAL